MSNILSLVVVVEVAEMDSMRMVLEVVAQAVIGLVADSLSHHKHTQ